MLGKGGISVLHTYLILNWDIPIFHLDVLSSLDKEDFVVGF